MSSEVWIVVLVVFSLDLVLSLIFFRALNKERREREKLSKKVSARLTPTRPPQPSDEYYGDDGEPSYYDSHGPREGGPAPQGQRRRRVVNYHDH